jgi:hypothetical protein
LIQKDISLSNSDLEKIPWFKSKTDFPWFELKLSSDNSFDYIEGQFLEPYIPNKSPNKGKFYLIQLDIGKESNGTTERVFKCDKGSLELIPDQEK